jgi:inorganic pyrophosphatase
MNADPIKYEVDEESGAPFVDRPLGVLRMEDEARGRRQGARGAHGRRVIGWSDVAAAHEEITSGARRYATPRPATP